MDLVRALREYLELEQGGEIEGVSDDYAQGHADALRELAELLDVLYAMGIAALS